MLVMLGLNVGMKSSGDDATLSVGEVAEQVGLATHVLRHWESMGLFSPARAGDRRRYRRGDLYKVAVILRAKEAGLSLEAIRQMVTTHDPAARTTILRSHQEDLTRRIAVL